MQSIRWRLVISYFIVIILTLSLIGVYLTSSVEKYILEQKKVATLTQANVLAGYISQYQDLSEKSISYLLQQQHMGSSSRLLMLDKDAKVTYDSNSGVMENKYLPTKVILNAIEGNNSVEMVSGANGELVAGAAVPVIKNKKINGVIYYQTSAAENEQLMSRLWTALLLITLVVCLLTGVAGVIMSGIITAPITELTEKLSAAVDDTDDFALEKTTGGEVGRLIDSFNKMTKKIHEQEEKRQEFVSNASHELKTPLSSIKLISDSLLNVQNAPAEMVNEFLTDMNVQVDRLTRIVDKLLTLTRMDNSGSVSRMEFAVSDLSEICSNVAKALRPLAEQKHIELLYNAEAAIYSKVERDRIWEAIYNVLDNSIKYTKEGGRVSLNVSKDDTSAIITIKDSGIGIAQEELYKIFDRFYRVDKARARETGGTGLGLSIALTAVELHGGNIQVESEEGVGSTFRIIIPITFK